MRGNPPRSPVGEEDRARDTLCVSNGDHGDRRESGPDALAYEPGAWLIVIRCRYSGGVGTQKGALSRQIRKVLRFVSIDDVPRVYGMVVIEQEGIFGFRGFLLETDIGRAWAGVVVEKPDARAPAPAPGAQEEHCPIQVFLQGSRFRQQLEQGVAGPGPVFDSLSIRNRPLESPVARRKLPRAFAKELFEVQAVLGRSRFLPHRRGFVRLVGRPLPQSVFKLQVARAQFVQLGEQLASRLDIFLHDTTPAALQARDRGLRNDRMEEREPVEAR